jgi:hypothetical protein
VSNSAAMTMNQLFKAAGGRGEHRTADLFARFTGSPTVDTSGRDRGPLRERLSGALNDLESAQRAGDETAIDFHEFRVDRAVNEARAARTSAEPEQGAPQPAGYDGGVRGRRSPPQPGLSQESASSLFLRAMQTSRQERAAREADAGQTITANNF